MTQLGCGIYDLPAAKYHADEIRDEPTLSRSGIVQILSGGSMADFAASSPRLRNPDWPAPESDDTDANILGSVIHALVLGGNGGTKYIVGSPSDHVIPSSKTGERYSTWSGKAKEWKQAREAEGNVVITDAINAKAVHIAGILTAAIEERFGKAAWAGRKVEQTVIWSRTLNDGSVIWLRARLDAILPDGTIVDVKTTALGMSDAELGKQIALGGLDIQCEVYREGALAVSASLPPFVFAWQRTVPPYTTCFVDLERCDPPWNLAATRMVIDVAAHKFGACLRSGEWPDRSAEANPVAPGWWKEQRGLMLLEETEEEV